jgi:hypothetical protein
MIAKEGLPALRRGPLLLTMYFANRGLADVDPELEQFAVNPWRSHCATCRRMLRTLIQSS